MIEISRFTDKTFGNCVKMSNGTIELHVTIDFGPRVIHFARVGMENMFFNDTDKTTLGEPQEVYGGDCLKLYGGHRIWIAPEILPRCYYPDSAAVEYHEIENGVSFVAPVERVNNIQKIMNIQLMEDAPVVKLSHVIKNCGVWDIELAPWCITMMAAGGKEVVPMPSRQTGLLLNRSISLWDYSNMADTRVRWGKKYITLTQRSDMAEPFKFGINNENGYAAYFNKGQVFFKFFEPEDSGFYPDNGCSYETYTNGKMLEMETLGEMTLLEPGQAVTHEEEWELYEAATVPSDDEADIEKSLSAFV